MGWVTDSALKEAFYYEQLPCGMPVYILPKPGFRQMQAIWHIGFGALHRTIPQTAKATGMALPAGVAHFLEHRQFVKESGDIADRFAQLGAEVNAYTAHTHTAYFFTANRHFFDCLTLLKETVMVAGHPAAAVEQEREIIAHEIQLYHDNYEWVGSQGAIKRLYGGAPISDDIAGTETSIQQITPKLLTRVHDYYYQPANMALFIGGDLNAPLVCEQLRQWQDLNACPNQTRPPAVPLQRPTNPLVEPFEQNMPIASPRICLGFRDRRAGLGGKALLTRELALDLALDILFSPASAFFQRTYQQGLIEAETFEWDVQLEQAYGYVLICGDTPDPNALKAQIIAELTLARTGSQLEEAFTRTKRKAYGHMIEQYEQVDTSVEIIHRSVLSQARPFDLYAVTRDITLEDVRDCLSTCLEPDRLVTSVIYPEQVSV